MYKWVNQPGVLGDTTKHDHRGVVVHTYRSPEDGLFVTSKIVETSEGLVVFDAVFHLAHATALADYIVSIGKPVNRFILSHIHPDHGRASRCCTIASPQPRSMPSPR